MGVSHAPTDARAFPVRSHKLRPKYQHVRDWEGERERGVLDGGVWVRRKMHCADVLNFNGPQHFFRIRASKKHFMIYEYTWWHCGRISLQYKIMPVTLDHKTKIPTDAQSRRAKYKVTPIQSLFIGKQTAKCAYWPLLCGKARRPV